MLLIILRPKESARKSLGVKHILIYRHGLYSVRNCSTAHTHTHTQQQHIYMVGVVLACISICSLLSLHTLSLYSLSLSLFVLSLLSVLSSPSFCSLSPWALSLCASSLSIYAYTTRTFLTPLDHRVISSGLSSLNSNWKRGKHRL